MAYLQRFRLILTTTMVRRGSRVRVPTSALAFPAAHPTSTLGRDAKAGCPIRAAG